MGSGGAIVNSRDDLLVAFHMGCRMTLHAYGLQEPPLGENLAMLTLFCVADGRTFLSDRRDGQSELHFNREMAERIVEAFLDRPDGYGEMCQASTEDLAILATDA